MFKKMSNPKASPLKKLPAAKNAKSKASPAKTKVSASLIDMRAC